jgi:nitrite reductase/ring-hydroxylating ferredoxin subunit
MSAVTPTPSRLDPEPVTRRDVLGLASLWTMGATLLFALGGILRLPRAAVLPTPSRKFKVALPESLADGQPFVPEGRSVALFRDGEGVYAISTICTHLGCIVKATGQGFDCPCHGSKFAADGTVVRGPAPTALKWLKVSGAGGAVVVDEETAVAAGTKVRA